MSANRAIFNPQDPRKVVALMDQAASQSKDGETSATPILKLLEALTPSQLMSYVEPEGYNLVGDYHLQLEAKAVLAGAPEAGKSRASLALAIAGSIGRGASWFKLSVHRRFRTLVVQNENGRGRLLRQFNRLKEQGKLPNDVDSWIRITPPPPFGMRMEDPVFRAALAKIIEEFAPDLIIIDPWNAICRDIMERDFHQAFVWLDEVIAGRPMACLIVHHLRKPRADDRSKGRDIINLLAGSFTIFSVPRAVMALQRVSDDLNEKRVVFSTLKNNDSDQPRERSAWEMLDDEFHKIENFDFKSFDKSESKPRKINDKLLSELFEDGNIRLKRADAEKQLEKIAQVSRSTAYDALKIDGPFRHLLKVCEDGRLEFRKDAKKDDPDQEEFPS